MHLIRELAAVLLLIRGGRALEELKVRSNPMLQVECDGEYKSLGTVAMPITPAGASPGFFHFYPAAASQRAQVTAVSEDPTQYQYQTAVQLVFTKDSPPMTDKQVFLAGQPKSTSVVAAQNCANGGVMYTPGPLSCQLDGVQGTVVGAQEFKNTVSCVAATNMSCFLRRNSTTVVVSGLNQGAPHRYSKVLNKGVSASNWAGTVDALPSQVCTVNKRHKAAVQSYSNVAAAGFTVDLASGLQKDTKGIKSFFKGVFKGIKNIWTKSKGIRDLIDRVVIPPQGTQANYAAAAGGGEYESPAELEFDDYENLDDEHKIDDSEDYEDLIKDDDTYQKAYGQDGSGSVKSWGSSDIRFNDDELDSLDAEYVMRLGVDSLACVDLDLKEAVLTKIGSCFVGGGCRQTKGCINNGEMPKITLTDNDVESLKSCSADFACQALRLPEVVAKALEDDKVSSKDKEQDEKLALGYFFWALDIFFFVVLVLQSLYMAHEHHRMRMMK